MTSQDELTARLTDTGSVPEQWKDSFAAVDRGLFIPVRCWVDDEHGRATPLDRDGDPAAWLAAVYTDQPIITQLNDGATRWPATSGNATSSASEPRVVLAMLDALDVRPGHRVLEIGTGTGYHAALLAHHLGGEGITSVEVDPGLVEQARAALRSAGCTPSVVCGDGVDGHPPGAPYHRIVSTAAVLAGHLPTAWVEQLHPGGRIVTPWKTAWGSGALLSLTRSDGQVTGSVVGDAFFMSLRAQRSPYGYAGWFGRIAAEATQTPVTRTQVPPFEVAIDPDGAFSAGLHLRDVQRSVAYTGAEHYELLLYHVASTSWATVQVTGSATEYSVRQGGPRALWAEAESAHVWWAARDKPARTRFGVTAGPSGECTWLDRPENVVATWQGTP